MTIQQEPGQDSGTTRQIRAVVPPISAHLPPTAATITAELPAVGGTRGRAPVSTHRPRRRPAPVAVRMLVWVLVLVFIVVAAGTIVARVRPNALSALRSTATTGEATTPSATPSTATARFQAVSATTYQVSSPTFAIVITAPGRCWIEEHSPAGSSTMPFAQTIPAGSTTLHVTGSASVIAEAQVTSIEVTVAGTSVGTVPNPKENVTYTFESVSSS